MFLVHTGVQMRQNFLTQGNRYTMLVLMHEQQPTQSDPFHHVDIDHVVPNLGKVTGPDAVVALQAWVSGILIVASNLGVRSEDDIGVAGVPVVHVLSVGED